jgi:hypothetical protein
VFISKSPRRHVSQKVDDFGVPVIYKEQRTGRLGSVAEYRFSEMMSILCVLRIYCFVICSNFQVVGIPKKS